MYKCAVISCTYSVCGFHCAHRGTNSYTCIASTKHKGKTKSMDRFSNGECMADLNRQNTNLLVKLPTAVCKLRARLTQLPHANMQISAMMHAWIEAVIRRWEFRIILVSTTHQCMSHRRLQMWSQQVVLVYLNPYCNCRFPV